MKDKMIEEIENKVAAAKAQVKQEAQEALAPKPLAPAVQPQAAAPMLPETPGWGVIEEIAAGDLLVPKILHQEATSAFAKDGLCRAGDFCDSFTGNILAAKDSKLYVIIFDLFKTMIVSRFDDRAQKYQYEKTIQIDWQNAAQVAKMPFYENIDGQSYQNSLQYNFYCLIPTLIDDLPFVISFRGKKKITAQKIITMMVKLDQHGRAGTSVVFELNSFTDRTTSNDKGSWIGINVKQGRDATPEEQKIAHDWYLKSKKQKFVAAEEHVAAQGASDDEPPF